MDLRDYIEAGIKKYRTAVALARALKQNPNALCNAKYHQQGLPNYACAALADLIGVERINIIAASELVTETNPDRRNLWLPHAQPCQYDRRTDARYTGIEQRQSARASDFAETERRRHRTTYAGAERRNLSGNGQWTERRTGDRRGRISAATPVAQQTPKGTY